VPFVGARSLDDGIHVYTFVKNFHDFTFEIHTKDTPVPEADVTITSTRGKALPFGYNFQYKVNFDNDPNHMLRFQWVEQNSCRYSKDRMYVTPGHRPVSVTMWINGPNGFVPYIPWQ
jgi:hypothetical protein